MYTKKSWTGDWTFRNYFLQQHGSTGTETVTAVNERDAKQKIIGVANRALFGSMTTFWSYFDVSNLRENS